MSKVFLSGDDLKQFLLHWHGYGGDPKWAEQFRQQHPGFQRDGLVEIQVAAVYQGKTILEVRKAIITLSPEGILVQPMINAGDIGLDRPVPKLYFSFKGQGEYWGNQRSPHFPDVDYPYLRISGAQI